VQEAIKAGSMRRAYLKAIGMNMNCSPPAAPSWFTPVAKITAEAAPAPAEPVVAPVSAPTKPKAATGQVRRAAKG
jgi:hypothetical protein